MVVIKNFKKELTTVFDELKNSIIAPMLKPKQECSKQQTCE